MEFGLSSSCFYPQLVEQAFRTVGEAGVKTAEIFMNSPSELHGKTLNELCSIRDYYGIDVRTIHPFTSAYETILLFSEYDRRTDDGVELYKHYFDAATKLGAKYIVLHGGWNIANISIEKYAENYIKLHNSAIENGLHIAHENVRMFYASDPKFMKALADRVGDEFRMVLDIKQCRRTEQNPYDFIEMLGDKIVQVHISDGDAEHDCLPPGTGNFDFTGFLNALKSKGYDKSCVIELYKDNYKSIEDLQKSIEFLKKL